MKAKVTGAHRKDFLFEGPEGVIWPSDTQSDPKRRIGFAV